MTDITCRNNFDRIVSVPKEKFVFRPSAYGLILRDDKVLLMRNKGDGKLWPPGGGIEIGESREDALHREISEETGLEVEINKYLFVRENFFYFEPTDEAYHAFLFFYLCTPLTNELLSDDMIDDLESERPRWISVDTLHENQIAEFGNDIIEAIKILK